MALFSQRNNYNVRECIQLEYIESETRNLIWNEFYERRERDVSRFNKFAKFIWSDILKFPLDELPHLYNGYDVNYKFLKECVLDEVWYKVFDIIEVASCIYKKDFIDSINRIFEMENCGYRIIDNHITEVVCEEEIKEIEDTIALEDLQISTHIKNALEKYSDRVNPDYRNSIKESISAVECMCRKLTGEKTLGKALNKLESDNIVLNQRMKQGLEQLYAYTNSKNGIRHALMDEETITKDDAKFMLVICCAFVNYIKEKASK